MVRRLTSERSAVQLGGLANPAAQSLELVDLIRSDEFSKAAGCLNRGHGDVEAGMTEHNMHALQKLETCDGWRPSDTHSRAKRIGVEHAID